MCRRGRRVQRTRRREWRNRKNGGLAPLSFGQIVALARAFAYEIGWVLPHTARELRRWRARALVAADMTLREDAISALVRKRAQSEGAALLATLADRRSLPLLRVLLCYQLIWDGLDSIHERSRSYDNGVQLHLTVVDALDPWRPARDYFRLHAQRDDTGYLAALVANCRQGTTRLASFAKVRPMLLVEAHRSLRILAINHDLDSARRQDRMKVWVQRERPAPQSATWFERAAASGAALASFAMLAHASQATVSQRNLSVIHDSYPWASAVATMLDSYVDRAEDDANGDHCYIAYYPTPEVAVERTARLIREALAGVRALHNPHRHVVIVASMVAMYLTKDSSRTVEFERCTRQLAASGGTLTRALIPIVRAWRVFYALRCS